MLLLSFPCLSHLSWYCAEGQMFLMELPHHEEHCAFCGTLSGGGASCNVIENIVIGRLFIIFLGLNQL